MKLALSPAKKSKKRRTPGDAFKACPSCGSKNLAFEIEEVFCAFCHWNSIEAHAEAFVMDGGLDVALYAYEESLKKSAPTITDLDFDCEEGADVAALSTSAA